jgi:hypothetical protein
MERSTEDIAHILHDRLVVNYVQVGAVAQSGGALHECLEVLAQVCRPPEGALMPCSCASKK